MKSIDENIHPIIESIKVIAQTPYEQLPHIAKERLGIKENQKNILLRITLRDLEKSITNQEVNQIYTKIYSKIHLGENGYKI